MARDERRAAHAAARAARPRQDWTFEVRFGEKLYSFTWHWLTLGFETQVTDAAPLAVDNPVQEPIAE